VQFYDSSSDPDGYVAEWSWNFGDGSTSSESSPAHTYAAPGQYTVTLVVTDEVGTHSAPHSQVIDISDPGP
jgi:PKD repeat protein